MILLIPNGEPIEVGRAVEVDPIKPGEHRPAVEAPRPKHDPPLCLAGLEMRPIGPGQYVCDFGGCFQTPETHKVTKQQRPVNVPRGERVEVAPGVFVTSDTPAKLVVETGPPETDDRL